VVAPEVPAPANAWTYRSPAPLGTPRWKDAMLAKVYAPEKFPGKKFRMSSLL
jgi:hypothetical protein